MAKWSVTSTREISNNKRIDSEFFHPNYLEVEEKVINTGITKKLGELGKFLIGPFGSVFHVRNYDSTSNYRYIRGKDVKPFTLLDDDSVYMPEKDYNRLKKYAVSPGDLLISVVGTLGNVAVVPENVEGIFSCKSTVFRDSSIDAYYLLVYFNCKYGRNCLLRRQRGAIQSGLNKDDLETVPVPVFTSEIQKSIGNLIRDALRLIDLSKKLYNQAQDMLDKELGLDKVVYTKSNTYETSYSEVLRNDRSDPEFYHTKYNPLLESIYNYKGGSKPLSQISRLINPNFNPSKQNGDFNYLEIGDVDISNGSYSTNVISSNNLPANAKIKLNGGELIISQVRPTRGAIALIDEDLSKEIICSGAFYVCTLNDKSQSEVTFLYLRVVKEIFEKYCGGTSYPTIESRYLAKFPVPQFEPDFSKEVKKLIIESKRAKIESDKLIEEAKNRVEALIEGGVSNETI